MGVQQAGRTEAVVDFKKKKKKFFFLSFSFHRLLSSTDNSLFPRTTTLPSCHFLSSVLAVDGARVWIGSCVVVVVLFFFVFCGEKKRRKRRRKKRKEKKKKAEKKKAEKKRKENKKKKDRERKGTQERPRAASMDFLASSLFCGTSLTLPRSIRTAFVLPLS